MADKTRFKPFEADVRRARLTILAQIATSPLMARTGAHDLLDNALKAEKGSTEREDKLIEFFNKYIPKGWIINENEISEDQHFLLYAPKQEESFWWDWG